MEQKHLLLALCLLFVSNFLPVSITIVDASIKPISKIPQLWEGRNYHAKQKTLAAPALKSTPLKAEDEDSEEKNSEEEEEEDDIMADPPPTPKKDDGAKGNSSSSSSSSNNGNKKNTQPSKNEDDDIMKDLFNPNKTTSGTPKPTVVINNGGKNKKIGIGAVKPAEAGAPSDDLKEVMDGAMAKATSIATNIGDAIKAALNSVAIALKNATEVTENSNSKSNTTAVSSASCRPPSKGAISTTPLNMRSPNGTHNIENCSDTEVASEAIKTTASAYKSDTGSGPISAITTTTRRQRRSSEVAKWPPQLPYAYGPHESHLLYNYAAGTGSTGSNTNDVKDMNKHVDSSAPNSEGGIISQGQVGSEEESGSEEDTSAGASNPSSESGNNGTAETGGSGDASSSDTEGEEDKDAASFTPEVDAEEVTNPTTGGRGSGSGSGSPKMGSGGMDNNNNNGNTNMPGSGAGIGNPNIQSTTQKNVSVTVTNPNPAVDSIGIGSVSSSSSSSTASGFPAYPVMKKPGRCRPLTKGLSCIALAPDASQCSTDNGCPGTKKCCYYGCAPYTGVGICEFPVM